ncbi:hypothetical protein ACQPYE_02315 [Actinosynnema sp. CA-299493]
MSAQEGARQDAYTAELVLSRPEAVAALFAGSVFPGAVGFVVARLLAVVAGSSRPASGDRAGEGADRRVRSSRRPVPPARAGR